MININRCFRIEKIMATKVASIQDIVSGNPYLPIEEFNGQFTEATPEEIKMLCDYLCKVMGLSGIGASRMVTQKSKFHIPFIFDDDGEGKVMTSQKFPLHVPGLVRIGNEVCFYV